MTALYHLDPYMKSFRSRVVSCELIKPGVYALTLENTCFYPTGGGQPCDLGTLDGHKVTDVSQTEEDGPIVHTVLSDVPLCGEVAGQIDWARRYDHMQQHTGQHLLSHAVYELFGGYSLGLHVGEQDAYVDVRTDETHLDLDRATIERLERDADALITAGLPIHQFFPTEEELAALPLRKKPPYHAHLRIVHAGQEAVACCGTHLNNTAEARLVRITGCARSHGNLRIFFLAGDRAVKYLRTAADAAENAAKTLSCGVPNLENQVEKLKSELQESQHALNLAKKELALQKIREARPVKLKEGNAVVERLDGLDGRQLQELAAELVKQGAGIACLLSEGEKGVQAVVAARPPFDAGAAFKALKARFPGKGGGRADMAQGLLETADRDGALEALEGLYK